MTSLTPFGIIAAGMVPVLLGMVWYHPQVFGAHWMQMSGISPEMSERVRLNRWKYGLMALIGGMLTAYIMDTFSILAGVSSTWEAIRMGFWSWAGFVMPILLGSIMWEGRDRRLYFINAGYWLVAFLLMAVLLYKLSTI